MDIAASKNAVPRISAVERVLVSPFAKQLRAGDRYLEADFGTGVVVAALATLLAGLSKCAPTGEPHKSGAPIVAGFLDGAGEPGSDTGDLPTRGDAPADAEKHDLPVTDAAVDGTDTVPPDADVVPDLPDVDGVDTPETAPDADAADTDDAAETDTDVPPECTPEQCNGLDDDCDGATDNLPDLGAECLLGMGICEATGQKVCDLIEDVGYMVYCNAPIIEPAATDPCDHLDNDCNGVTDDGFPVGADCSVGTGVCEADGTLDCNTPTSVACTAIPLPPAEEPEVSCNGLDDNCDGLTDTHADGTTLSAPCGTFEGVCEQGIRFCIEGEWDPICAGEKGPENEICDALDNNCNGKIDEDWPVGKPCDGPDGDDCAHGTWSCGASGQSVKCDNETVTDIPEACDGLDNDCDGATDEVADGLADMDGDGICDTMDPDNDNDGVVNATDNCPVAANPAQADFDADGVGDACEDSDGDGVLDVADNCKTIANPDQAPGVAPNGSACTPTCATAQETYTMKEGETATMQFVVSAAETFACDAVVQSFADPQAEHTVAVAVSPADDTVYDQCQVVGYGVSVFCPTVTVDVNHPHLVTLESPADQQVGILPDGDQFFTDANTIVFLWNVLDPDGDAVQCQPFLVQGAEKTFVGAPINGAGPDLTASIPAGQFAPRSDYCWNVECTDTMGITATAGAFACFTTSEKGLILWARLNEGSGATTKDSSGAQLVSSGTLNNFDFSGGAAAWVPGVSGTALQFNGLATHVTFEPGGALSLGTGDFTLAAWVNVGKDGAIIEHRTPESGYELLVGTLGTTPYLAFYGAQCGATLYASGIALGKWQQVAVTRTAGTVQVLIDGALAAEGPCTADLANGSAVTLGCNTPDITCQEPFDGVIDDARIYNRALPPAEIFAP